ncbi:hypothetical protein ACFY9F_24605 [Streptomyces sp. NPDC012421]|uniref:hypothetical protein n=1 Tax=unclassified Streptomyces TaxID=2593676 RepID=UPI0036C26E4B
MAEPPNSEILDSIASLRAALTSDFAPPGKAPISELKQSLVGAVPKITTQEFIENHFKEALDQLKAAHEEVVKSPWQEIMELLGFDKIYKGIEEIFKNGLVAALPALLLGLTQALLPLIAIVVGAAALAASRALMKKLLNGDVITMRGPNGPFSRENAEVVNQRERRIADGGTSVADLVGDPANAQNAETLARALEKLNPQVERFGAKAPSFLNSFKRLPNQSKADKAATVLETMGEAIKKINATKLKKIADGLEKLNKELDTFQPTKLPTDTQLGNTAQAMSDLATQTGTLRDKFRDLRGSITSLDQVIAGSGAGSN